MKINQEEVITNALIKSEKKYRSLIEKAYVAVLVIDQYQAISYGSNSVESIIGLAPAKLIGRNIFELLSSQIENELHFAINQICIHWGDTQIVKDIIIEHANGERLYFDASITNLFEVPEINGCVLYLHNITERKLAQQKLMQVSFELDSFVYKASHDMRAPLLSLLGLIDITQRDYPSDTLHYLELMKKSVLRLDKFIVELTQYSRNERVEPGIEKVNFEEIISEVLANFQHLPAMDNVHVNLQLNHEVPVYSDIFRLKIILNNLISNAVKYSDTNKEHSYVRVAVSSDKKVFRVKIEDNGIGIMEEHTDKVFDMFYRATQKSEGSGLGLYIVKKVVERMKGTIELKTTFKKNTSFMITLPNFYHPDENIS
jgi:PAS domain S-box-containing protein